MIHDRLDMRRAPGIAKVAASTPSINNVLAVHRAGVRDKTGNANR